MRSSSHSLSPVSHSRSSLSGGILVAIACACFLQTHDVTAFHPALQRNARSHHSLRESSSCAAGQYSSTSLFNGYLDLSESAPRNIPFLEEWAETYGVQRTPAFSLADSTTELDYELTQGQDFSAYAAEDCPAESPLLFVPGGMFISSYGARDELGVFEEAESLLGRLGGSDQFPLFYVFVKILVEYEKGEESPWFPYLDSLPRCFSNGASMTPACYECLPPLVSSLSMEERVKYINFNQALKKVDYVSDYVKEDGDLTKWAFNVASTRSLAVEGERVIIPMADMFNHGTETEVEITYDEEGNCVVYTTCDVAAGSPLRMSYGDPTNPSALLATYGFLDESSPATFCKLMSIQPSSELRDIGLDFSRMLFYKDSGEVSEEVWDVLLYDSLKNNRKLQKEFYQACMEGDESTKQRLHQQYLFETSNALKKHIDSFLKQLEELSEKASIKDVKEHPRIPLILHHNAFVKETFLKVKANIDPIAAQATPY